MQQDKRSFTILTCIFAKFIICHHPVNKHYIFYVNTICRQYEAYHAPHGTNSKIIVLYVVLNC